MSRLSPLIFSSLAERFLNRIVCLPPTPLHRLCVTLRVHAIFLRRVVLNAPTGGWGGSVFRCPMRTPSPPDVTFHFLVVICVGVANLVSSPTLV